MAKNTMNTIGIAIVFVLALAVIYFLARGSGAGYYYGQKGSVMYSISDAPSLGTVTAVNVKVTNVSIHSTTTGQWYSAPISGKGYYNLTALGSTSAFMANANLTPGIYDEIALTVASVNVTANGMTSAAVLPSGTLKIFGKFNITNSTTNWVNIDFRANQSVHATGSGKIIILPVIQTNFMQGSQTSVASNGVVVVSSRGKLVSSVNDGMAVNGTLISNFTVPNSANLTIGANGNIGLGH